MKMAVTQLVMRLSEKFFHLHDPQTPLFQENITISYFPKGPDRMGLPLKSYETLLCEKSAISGKRGEFRDPENQRFFF